MLELFGHPFSSYTWKALIALYENDTPFTFRMLDEHHPENGETLRALSPQGKFPLLVDGDAAIWESSVIVEYLQHRAPGRTTLIPSAVERAVAVRMLDRFFDHYVMNQAQVYVDNALRPPGAVPDRFAETQAGQRLQRSYRWLDARMQENEWACGDDFTLADCAAAPSLFYADWVEPIPAPLVHLRDYRNRLLARPSIKRCVDDARPYRPLFPLGAPDRD